MNQRGGMPPVTAGQVYWNKGLRNLTEYRSEKYQLVHSEDSSQFNLTIMSPTTEDSGLYTVIIDHEAGSDSLTFQLEVLGITCMIDNCESVCMCVCVCVCVFHFL